MSENLLRDGNRVTVAGAQSSTDATVVLPLKEDPVTGRLLIDSASASGTVTSVSVVTANGFAGTVATATTTPAITISTTATGILQGNGTAISAATTTGSGNVVLATSPTLVTPTLGVATATSINKLTITAPVTGSTLTIADGKTLTANNSLTLAGTDGKTLTLSNNLTFTGTDGSSVAFGTGGTVLYTGSTVPLTVGSTTIASGANTKVLFDNSGVLGEYTISGSGNVAMTTSPAFTTPTLGVATATTINGNTFTTGSYTLTGTAAKTLNFTNTLTLSGTDSTTITFPTTSATIARTDAAQTFMGTQTFSQTILTANAIAASGNAATVPVTSGRNIVTNNSAATLTITMTTTSAVNMQTCIVQILDASAVAQSITWVNTENSAISAPTTSNGSTTLPLTVGFIYNSATSKWRCIASA